MNDEIMFQTRQAFAALRRAIDHPSISSAYFSELAYQGLGESLNNAYATHDILTSLRKEGDEDMIIFHYAFGNGASTSMVNALKSQVSGTGNPMIYDQPRQHINDALDDRTIPYVEVVVCAGILGSGKDYEALGSLLRMIAEQTSPLEKVVEANRFVKESYRW